MSQHYDVAVIGTQLSGIIAAALLAKRGRRVLLIDHGESATTYRRGGRNLPLLPTLLPTLDQAPHVQRVHDELGLGPELRALARPSEAAFQTILPRHRLDVTSAPDAILAELKLEFPDVADAIGHFFTRLVAIDATITDYLSANPPLPPSTWLQRLRGQISRRQVMHLDAPFETEVLLEGIPEDHPVRTVLLGPLAFFSHLWPDQPSTFQAARLIARYFRGVSTVQDGAAGITRLLLAAAERSGVSVRPGAVVRKISSRGRRLHELVIEDERLSHSADIFISNTLGPFYELLEGRDRHPRFVAEEQAVAPSGGLLVLNCVVDRAVVPEAMAAAAFLLNGRRQTRGDEPADPPLFVQRAAPPPTGPGSRSRDPEIVVLSVACPVRIADIAHSPERINAVKTQMLGRLRRVVPFLDSYLQDASLTIDTAGWELETEGGKRRVEPWRLHPIYEPHQRPLLGVAARSLRTYYRNLIHCGRDVIPGLGLEGEYITGYQAADLVYARR